MKKSIKLFVIPMALMLSSQLIGCNVAKKEIALITDVGDIDDGSFNQGSWEAIKEWCTRNNKTYDYYRPFADSDFARKAAIKQAVYKGAKVIVCPGSKFPSAVNQAQYDYKDQGVKFMLLDSATNDDVLENCVCIGYKAEFSGYLAGYSIMIDYLKYDYEANNKTKVNDTYKFGYCGGMASDGVLQFGFGYIQGIVEAANYFTKTAHQINQPNLEFLHNYAGVYAQSDDACTRMKQWYAQEVKCIFPCGGKLYQSITEAAKDYNRKNKLYDELSKDQGNFYKPNRNAARWVGVDSDQYTRLKDKHDKNSIYTSALKGLKETIDTALTYYKDGDWKKDGVIGGPYKQGSEPMIFEPTYDESGKMLRSAEDVAKDYIESQSLTFKDYDATPEKVSDNKYKIVWKSKGIVGAEYKDYCAQTKSWTLGLGSQFGQTDKGRTIEEKDYVGIPFNEVDKTYDPSTGILRGFNSFTIDEYKKLKEAAKTTSYVYGADGLDLLDSTGKAKPASDKGDPTFMSDSNNYYLKDNNGNLKSYNELCFGGYPADKIKARLIK